VVQNEGLWDSVVLEANVEDFRHIIFVHIEGPDYEKKALMAYICNDYRIPGNKSHNRCANRLEAISLGEILDREFTRYS